MFISSKYLANLEIYMHSITYILIRFSGISTNTLTTSADGPGALPPATNTTGTSGNDTYNGTFSGTAANADNGTFNSADNLAGGNGTDVAVIRVLSAFGVAAHATGPAAGIQDFRAPLMSSIETVLASNLTTSTIANSAYTTAQANAAASANTIATINMVSATGTTSVGSQNSNASTFTEFSNVANGTSITLDNADGYTAVNILGATSRTGTADALNVTISNGSGPTATTSTATSIFGVFSTLASAAAANTAPTVDNTFEVLNITTAGAFSRVQADVGTASGANSVTTVTVGGTGTAAATGFALQLSQNQAFANVTTINASGMTGTGGLYIITNNAQNLTFTGSANNDRIDLGAIANLTSADSFTFGNGTDIIGFSDNDARFTAAQKALITNTAAEGIALYGTLTNASLDGYGASQTLFAIGTGSAQTLNATQAITGLTTGQTLRIANDQTGAAGANGTGGAGGAAGVVTLTLTGNSVGTTFTLGLGGGIDITGGAGGNGASGSGNVDGGAGALAIDFVATPNVSGVTISSTGTSLNTITGGRGGSGNASSNAAGSGGSAIDSEAVQVYTITGSQNLTITGGLAGATGGTGVAAASFSHSASINASAFTGLLDMSGSNAADTIVAGTGGLNLRSVAAAGNTADGDAITLSSGRDQIQIATLGTSNVNTAGLAAGSMDVITGFAAGVDKFVVGAAPVSIATASTYTAAGTGTLSTDIGTAITAGGGLVANGAALVSITGTGAGTYLVIGDGNAGFNAAQDNVVRLVGTTGTVSSADFITAFLA